MHTPADANAVLAEARAALEAAEKEAVDTTVTPKLRGRVSPGITVALLTLPVFGYLVGSTVGDTSAFLAGGGGVLVAAVAHTVLAMRSLPKLPRSPPGTLAWEAQLSLAPLRTTLDEKLSAPQTPESLAEIAFFTDQMRVMLRLVEREGRAAGRGYIGFDAYGSPSTWG